MKIMAGFILISVLFIGQAMAETSCRVISMYTTQTGQAIYKISCPSVPVNPGDLIIVKKGK